MWGNLRRFAHACGGVGDDTKLVVVRQRIDPRAWDGGAVFSADCDVETSFHLEGDRSLSEQRGLRSMKEMCRIGRAPNVLKVRGDREE